MNRESPKAGQPADPSFTERELVERIVKQAIADGAFDQALQARLQGIADPQCGIRGARLAVETIAKIRKDIIKSVNAEGGVMTGSTKLLAVSAVLWALRETMGSDRGEAAADILLAAMYLSTDPVDRGLLPIGARK